MQQLDSLDRTLAQANRALLTLFGRAHAARSNPADNVPSVELSAAEELASARLMRVNHAGEVCAQALYQAQASGARDPAIRQQLLDAASEEMDHLAWCQQRLAELNARPSALNPVWYAGAYFFGWAAAKIADDANLSFVIETERQVEAHLQAHLERLPENDGRSRAIVAEMCADEARHAEHAEKLGGRRPNALVGYLMASAANVMKGIAARI